MGIAVGCGLEQLELDMPASQLLAVHRQSAVPCLPDPVAAVRCALNAPVGFPPLRRALTPDDHVAVLVDESLPQPGRLINPILEHLIEARIEPTAITLLCPPSDANQPWITELSDDFQHVRVEVHQRDERTKLSYLATTSKGRRLYLNRTAVDADQLVVLTRRSFDPLLGYAGAEGAIFPGLSDEATRKEMCGRLTMKAPGKTPWPSRQEAIEAAWLLGAPFLVQVIEGAGDDIAHVVGGSQTSVAEGERLLDSCWRVTVEQPADLVVASLAGDPARHGFAELAGALACAARVVKPDGRIVLLSQAAPRLEAGMEMLRRIEEPAAALKALREQMPPDMAAAFQWVSAVQKAKVYVLSGLDREVMEELFVTPLEAPSQARRLLAPGASCLVLADAHKTLAELKTRAEG